MNDLYNNARSAQDRFVTFWDFHLQAPDQYIEWRWWDVGPTSLNRVNVSKPWSKSSHLAQLIQ